MKVQAISQHCLERYLERTGSKKVLRALNQIDCMLATGLVKIGQSRYYSRSGWVLIVVKGVVRTMYKPDRKDYEEVRTAKEKAIPKSIIAWQSKTSPPQPKLEEQALL